MCGRLTLTHPNEALAALFGALSDNDLPESPRFNICPTEAVPVVISDHGRRLRSARWGLVPGWYKTPTDGPLIINARSDTVADKPAFREAIRQRRCLVLASGFYEWSAGENGARLPWYVTRADGQPMAFGGLWTPFDDGKISCAVVTMGAGPNLTHIHDREPLILEAGDWPLWLGEAGKGAAVQMKPTAPGVLQSWRVDPVVNSNRARGAALVEPVEA